VIKSREILVTTCLAAIFASSCVNAAATRITSFAALMAALNEGHRVIAIADNKKCTVKEYNNPDRKSDDLPDPDLEMTMGINFTSNFFLKYRDIGDKRYHVLTVANNMGSNADRKPLRRLKQIKIYDDNTAQMSAAAADFQTGIVKANIVTICGISNGSDSKGLSIFDYDAVV